MANYFVAGVGRALLFKGDTLFAECKTLADSSITIGVSVEEIRGGEGNALFGQYFHDSSFTMKLTDIMFNLEYIAANVGSDIDTMEGFGFEYGELVVTDGVGTLDYAPVSVTGSGSGTLWYKKVGSSDDYTPMQLSSKTVNLAEDGTYCVMYRKQVTEGVESITISSQFIPETLHAVLTVALYSGDSCNVEAATKAGEIVIDIPRFQLTGAMDISMSATGTAQTPLEGKALASGCSSCDGRSTYATITKIITGATWYDDLSNIYIEGIPEIIVGTEAKTVTVKVYGIQGSTMKLLDNSHFKFSVSGVSNTSITDGVLKVPTTVSSGTLTITAETADSETSAPKYIDTTVVTITKKA